jgi:sigma-B regulation protein RsbU (phosphoserine phosphatase)
VQNLRCAEVWGGIKDDDRETRSGGLAVSLYSSSCQGGRGGDIYCFSVCAEDMLTRIAVADVVGHGSAVSDVSLSLYQAMRNRMNQLDGGRVLADLNAFAARRGFQAITTASVVGYYARRKLAYFARAGDQPPLLRRGAEGTWRPLLPEHLGSDLVNMPLGVLPQTCFRQRPVHFEAGDRMLLYTDGLVEAPAPGGELFGLDRLRAVLDKLGDASLHATKAAVLDAVRQHTGGPLDHDDVTVLVVEVVEGATNGGAPVPGPG